MEESSRRRDNRRSVSGSMPSGDLCEDEFVNLAGSTDDEDDTEFSIPKQKVAPVGMP